MNKEYIKNIIDEIIYEAIIGKNPFREGDLVKLRPDVLRRHSQSVPSHAGYNKNEFSWRDTLQKLSDKIGKITRVFPDSKHVNIEFPQSWISHDEHGREYTVNTIGIDYTELLPAEKPDTTDVTEGFGYVYDKDMKKDPKHIPDERWRIKFNENYKSMNHKISKLTKDRNTNQLNNESIGTAKNKILAVLAALSIAAASADGWKHVSATNSTAEMYMRGDYIIAHPKQHIFVLINRADGKYVRVGEYKTLQQAKDATATNNGNIPVNEVKNVIKELIKEMWTGVEEKNKIDENARRDKNFSMQYTIPKPYPGENPVEYLKKHFKNHPSFQSFMKKHGIKKK